MVRVLGFGAHYEFRVYGLIRFFWVLNLIKSTPGV
jgi:hypothetical protein